MISLVDQTLYISSSNFCGDRYSVVLDAFVHLLMGKIYDFNWILGVNPFNNKIMHIETIHRVVFVYHFMLAETQPSRLLL